MRRTSSKHQASKRGYKHNKAEPIVKIVTMEATNENDGTVTRDDIRIYKHGATFGKQIASNHDRVTAGRILKQLKEKKA